MALSIATIKAAIKTQRESQLGEPTDAALADKIYTADATALFEILTVLASVSIPNPIDTNGDSLVAPTGVIQ